jgi:hypothetical protein
MRSTMLCKFIAPAAGSPGCTPSAWRTCRAQD